MAETVASMADSLIGLPGTVLKPPEKHHSQPIVCIKEFCMSRHELWFSDTVEKKLLEYRQQRRTERGGKVLTNEKAVEELLLQSLGHVAPVAVVPYEDVIRRLEVAEAQLAMSRKR